jgi:hypothetical protein
MWLFNSVLTCGQPLSQHPRRQLQSLRSVGTQPDNAGRAACVPHWVLHDAVAITSRLPIESTTTRSHADVVHAKALCASDAECVGVSQSDGEQWVLGGDEDGRGGPRAVVLAQSPASASWLKAVPFCLALPHLGGFLRNTGSRGRSVHRRPHLRGAGPSASVAAVTAWLKKNDLEVFAPRFEREGVGERELVRRAARLVDFVDVHEADELQKLRLVFQVNRDFLSV